MYDEYSISVIIPIFNEAKILETSVNAINKFLRENFRNYEVIIVESGSTDGSDKICDKIQRNNSNIFVIHEGGRNGFGSALQIGYKTARNDLLWLVTVDLPFSLEIIHKALPLLSEYDCILSYRCEDKRNVFRKFQSYVYNIVVKVFLGLKVRHVNSAFKVLKREIIQNINFVSNGWFFDAEVIYKLTKIGVPYTEIPVAVIDRRGGRGSVGPSSFINVIKELLFFVYRKGK
jgi:glycosyltransferase involved in cell wall biosynthesis